MANDVNIQKKFGKRASAGAFGKDGGVKNRGVAEFLKYRIICINHAFLQFIKFINAKMIFRALNEVSFQEKFGKMGVSKDEGLKSGGARGKKTKKG